ncbi:MAG: NYN domain-containing protein [Sulfurospirillaceae bacterium]|nr:NYN domain-containing protein [Sulfurospirillaceae bacterium]
MKDISEQKRIVVLIDADNAQQSKLELILAELSTHGHIIVKRAYGDWSSSYLKNWKESLNELAVQPIQQFAYTTGKNSTDASMIIDAMDLLYTQKFDAFALVSSDSDFTKLASRLKESEIYVFGFGEHKTPISFRNACDDFIFTENLKFNNDLAEEEFEEKSTKESKEDSLKELAKILHVGFEKTQDDEGWASVSAAGQYIKRQYPDFDPRTYGSSKITSLLGKLKEHFEMKRYPGKGTTTIVDYRPIVKKSTPKKR